LLLLLLLPRAVLRLRPRLRLAARVGARRCARRAPPRALERRRALLHYFALARALQYSA
jgi:hypothetical protein